MQNTKAPRQQDAPFHKILSVFVAGFLAILLLATVGLGTMWMAVFADVGVTVLAVFNAMRALKG